MKFNRRFYDASVNFGNISKERWVLAVVIGLASAYFLYSFFYIIRETFRVMSVAFANYPSYISDFHRRIYNIFFAGLSVIYGNSIALTYVLSRSQGVISKRNLKRSRVFNDQIFLNGNFAHWLLKIILVMGVFSMSMMDFDYLPFLYPAGVLMLLVFYLETWKTLLQILGKKKHLYLLIHFFATCVLAFGLSFINVTDYKSIDEASLEWKPIIDVPYSKFTTKENQHRDLFIDFKLRIKQDKLEIINNDGHRFSMNEVYDEIVNGRASQREELMDYISVSITADRNLPMHYIVDFQNKVCRAGVSKFVFVLNDKNLYESRFKRSGIEVRGCIPYIIDNEFYIDEDIHNPDKWLFEERMDHLKKAYKSKDKTEISIGKTIKVNGLIVPDGMLVNKFKNHINADNIFEYCYTMNTAYEDYIKVLSAHFEAVYTLRKVHQTIDLEYATETFNYTNKKEYDQHQDSLKQAFPISKIERIR